MVGTRTLPKVAWKKCKYVSKYASPRPPPGRPGELFLPRRHYTEHFGPRILEAAAELCLLAEAAELRGRLQAVEEEAARRREELAECREVAGRQGLRAEVRAVGEAAFWQEHAALLAEVQVARGREAAEWRAGCRRPRWRSWRAGRAGGGGAHAGGGGEGRTG